MSALKRAREHLEAGIQPSLKGRRVVLKDVVLVRADGSETPVAQEARRLRPNINLSFWSGETERETRTESLRMTVKARSILCRGRPT